MCIRDRSLEASEDGLVLGRLALNAFKEGIRPSYKRYLLEHSAEIFCLEDAYKVAKQYEQIEQIVGEGETSSSSDEYLSALTRVKFGLKDEGFQGRGRGSVRGRVSYDRGHSRDSYSDERRKECLTCGGRHSVTECYQKCGSCGKPPSG